MSKLYAIIYIGQDKVVLIEKGILARLRRTVRLKAGWGFGFRESDEARYCASLLRPGTFLAEAFQPLNVF
ncbi:hypothetical protein [Pseudarcicella hirudinis]|uniref:hypothetical protein n=1 Tax=Pseudarcicella hirudinis TaxID=1079859 RepID=UPI000B892C8F|nr:hypothetical protein [Pseudarcicella hirudinis]